jgi:hypothetical protein
MKMLTIQLTATDAVSIASLIATAGDVKETPPLGQVRILPDSNGQIIAVATNRYIAATYATDTAAPADLPADGFGLSAAACKFITANVKRGNKWHTPAGVELIANLDTRELSVRHGAAVLGDTWPAGNYPAAIVGMVDAWQPATDYGAVKLGQTWLNQLGKLIDGFTKVDAWLLELGQNAAYAAAGVTRDNMKPGPVRATSGRFTALIQPRVDR